MTEPLDPDAESEVVLVSKKRLQELEQLQGDQNPRWWESEGIASLRAGVFEGGGAKGIAYAGALDAVRQSGAWFDAVAGASAGAITALMVAAGLRPEQIMELTVSAPKAMSKEHGVFRLRHGNGYFSKDPLTDLLNKVVNDQVTLFERGCREGPVTFRRLFEATGIELNIVCADISRQRLVVFSAHETPDCQVVECVMASSSIPFALAHSTLEVPDERGQTWLHTIVDGGVSANFPLFVFRDAGYRRYSRRSDPDPRLDVLAFVIKEEEVDDPFRDGAYARAKFVGRDAISPDWETRLISKQQESLVARAFAAIIWPAAIIADALMFVGGPRGRIVWPTRQAWLRHLLRIVSGVGSFFHPPVLALLGIVSIGSGLWSQETQAANHVASFTMKDAMNDWQNVLNLVLTVCFVFALPLLFILLAGAMVLNAVLLVPLKRLTHGLVHTYVAGAGALPWVEWIDGVIPLIVPKGVTTLSFELSEPLRMETIERARATTAAALLTMAKREHAASAAALGPSVSTHSSRGDVGLGEPGGGGAR